MPMNYAIAGQNLNVSAGESELLTTSKLLKPGLGLMVPAGDIRCLL